MLIFFSSPNAGAGVQPNHLMLTTTQQHIHTGSTVAASRRMCVYVCKMCDSSCAMSMFTQCTPISTPFSRQQKLMNNKKKKHSFQVHKFCSSFTGENVCTCICVWVRVRSNTCTLSRTTLKTPFRFVCTLHRCNQASDRIVIIHLIHSSAPIKPFDQIIDECKKNIHALCSRHTHAIWTILHHRSNAGLAAYAMARRYCSPTRIFTHLRKYAHFCRWEHIYTLHRWLISSLHGLWMLGILNVHARCNMACLSLHTFAHQTMHLIYDSIFVQLVKWFTQ